MLYGHGVISTLIYVLKIKQCPIQEKRDNSDCRKIINLREIVAYRLRG